MARARPDYAGLREYRRARSMGTMVGPYDGRVAQVWEVKYEPYGTFQRTTPVPSGAA